MDSTEYQFNLIRLFVVRHCERSSANNYSGGKFPPKITCRQMAQSSEELLQTMVQSTDIDDLFDFTHMLDFPLSMTTTSDQTVAESTLAGCVQYESTSASCATTTTVDVKSSIEHRCACHGKTFATASSLRRHTSPPAKQHHCSHDGCDRAFRHHHQLVDHERVHSGIKPFICQHPACTKSFRQSSHLAVHMQSHGKKRASPDTATSRMPKQRPREDNAMWLRQQLEEERRERSHVQHQLDELRRIVGIKTP
jgi:hypothetical protein